MEINLLSFRKFIRENFLKVRDRRLFEENLLSLETERLMEILSNSIYLYEHERESFLTRLFDVLGGKFKHGDIYSKITKNIHPDIFEKIFIGNSIRFKEENKHRLRAGAYYISLSPYGEKIFLDLNRGYQNLLRLQFILSHTEEPDFFLIADTGRFMFSGGDILFPFKFLYDIPKDLKYRCIYSFARLRYKEIVSYFDSEFIYNIADLFGSEYSNYDDDLFIMSFGIRKGRLMGLFKLLRSRLVKDEYKNFALYFDRLVLTASAVHKLDIKPLIDEDIITLESLKRYILELIEKREKEGEARLLPIILWFKEQYEEIVSDGRKAGRVFKNKIKKEKGINISILSPEDRVRLEKSLLILELSINDEISWEDVIKSYRKLAMRYHPDAAGEKNAEKFIEVSEAKETIEKIKEKYGDKLFL